MTVMDEFIYKAKDFADTVGKKTGELVGIGKLKFENADIQRELDLQYQKIGKMVYDAHQSGENIDEVLASLLEQVDALQNKAADLQQQMEELRRMKRCNECGNANPQSASFCQKCGNKL